MNESWIPTAWLEIQVSYIERMLPAAAAARLTVKNRAPGSSVVVGACTNGGPQPWPFEVELWVTARGCRKFPDRDQYVPYLPSILLRSHDEEIFLVLAHELRHAHQFAHYKEFYPPGYVPSSVELDAEEFAYEALFRWRQLRPERRCKIKAA